METYASLLPPSRLRRLFRLVLFLGLVYLFRHLLVLLVFFVVFERPMALASDWLQARRISRRLAVAGLALAILGALIAALVLGLGRAIRGGLAIRDELPAWFAWFRATPLYLRVEPHLHDAERIVQGMEHYATDALHYLAQAGHILVFLLIGFILAVVYLLERDEIEDLSRALDRGSLPATLLRWVGHTTDAISVTLQFQVIVAACNAALTLPVLLLVGIRHPVAFFFMVFFSGLVPVVGNFVAGAVLGVLAFQAQGWLGVAIFVGLTFVLHKLESYYLNPHLARRHVHLPGFVLIVSLLLFEHVFGLAGLFLSFPFLFVAIRIRNEFRLEDETAASSP